MSKKTITFFFKLICALFPVIALILYTFMIPFGYMDVEYPSWKYTKDIVSGSKHAAVEGEINCIILGDSRAMADLNPDLFKENTVNLAVGGATSIEMYYTLKNYIKNNGAPKEAIVMFAPFHYSIIDNFWTRDVYFNYLSISEMNEVYKSAKKVGSETLLSDHYFEDLVQYRLRTPNKYLPALINSKGFMRYSENKNTYEMVQAKNGHDQFGTLDGCSDLNYEVNYYEMHKTGDAALIDMYVRKLLSLCQNNNIKVTLSQPPMNAASYVWLQGSYINEYYEYMDSLQYLFPDFTVNKEIEYMDDMYFGDASHLNASGADVFTTAFCERYDF